MRRWGWGTGLLAVAVLLTASCATGNAPSEEEDQQFCPLLAGVAAAVPTGETWRMRLWSSRIGVAVDYTKGCDWFEAGEEAERFCQWWFKNSANEFYEINVNTAADCLRAGTRLSPDWPEWIRLEAAQVRFEEPPRLGKGVVAELEFSLLTDSENKSGGFVEIRLNRPR